MPSNPFSLECEAVSERLNDELLSMPDDITHLDIVRTIVRERKELAAERDRLLAREAALCDAFGKVLVELGKCEPNDSRAAAMALGIRTLQDETR